MAAFTTIDDPSAYFKIQLYTGNGSANHAITFDDTDTDMQPDLVWIKNRDATDQQMWFDSVRGATKVIGSNSTDAETTDADTLDSFTSDGFQVDADVKVNTNTEDYVAWCWKESATAGFDIISYEGTGDNTNVSTAQNVNHSLSAVPHLMTMKNRSASGQGWPVYHHRNTSAPETERLILNTTEATYDDTIPYDWNDTAPTSSVVSIGPGNRNNKDGDDIIGYLWSEKQGFSKFGSYVGNGNADAPFVYTGFRPKFLIIKVSDATNNWVLWDRERNPVNEGTHCSLIPNGTDVDNCNTGYLVMDFLSNGFKYTDTNAIANTSGKIYVYIAFAFAPFVNSSGVPCTGGGAEE